MNRTAFIESVAFWSPALPSWELAAQALRGQLVDSGAPPAAAHRPSPTGLAPNERRRAPDSVLMALEVAQSAAGVAGREPASLESVFASTYGDLAILDAVCQTLATGPEALSPTRFHHSVHNAASGYWAIAVNNMHSSTALAGGRHSFGAGLLEACTLCATEDRPVLLVAYDTEASGPVVSVNSSRGLLSVGLVLAPQASPRACWRLDWALAQGTADPPSWPSSEPVLQPLAQNAQAGALNLLTRLAGGKAGALRLGLAETLVLDLRLQPLQSTDN